MEILKFPTFYMYAKIVHCYIVRHQRCLFSCHENKSILMLALAIGFLATSCTKHEINDHSYQFNEAIGNLDNQLMLLNAVRSAKGYPIQFSKITSYSGNGRVSGKIGASIPFITNTWGFWQVDGNGFPSSDSFGTLDGSVSPEVSFNTGVNTLQIADLDTQEAQKQLKTIISDNQFRYYVKQGWDSRLAATVTVESFKLNSDFYDLLLKYYINKCSLDKNIRSIYCISFDDYDYCKNIIKPYKTRNSNYVKVTNDPRVYCEYKMFQWLWDAINVVPVELDLDPPKESPEKIGSKNIMNKKLEKFEIDVNIKTPSKPKSDADKRNMEFVFQDPYIQNYVTRFRDRQKSKKEEDKIEIFIPQLRSPERIVRYIGDLIAAQTLQSPGYMPQIRVESRNDSGNLELNLVNLFEVKRSGTGGASAVSIVGPEGQRFSIPRPDYSSPLQARSLQVLSLATDIYNSAVSGTSVPAPNTLLLAGGG